MGEIRLKRNKDLVTSIPKSKIKAAVASVFAKDYVMPQSDGHEAELIRIINKEVSKKSKKKNGDQ
jgi:hypothetical protein